MNKLTIEEQYLTLSQSKELQELGIDFNSANFAFNKVTNDLILLGNGIAENWGYGSKDRMYARTLSVAEMIEILPEYTSIEHYTGKWHISDNHNSLYPHFERNVLLRDALFEMIKLLKQNKFI